MNDAELLFIDQCRASFDASTPSYILEDISADFSLHYCVYILESIRDGVISFTDVINQNAKFYEIVRQAVEYAGYITGM